MIKSAAFLHTEDASLPATVARLLESCAAGAATCGARLETNTLQQCCLRADPIGLFGGKSVSKSSEEGKTQWFKASENWLPKRCSHGDGGEGEKREGGSDGERERMRRREVIREANLSEQQRESLGRG